MSYEGFSQLLCKNGHLHEEDSNVAYSETPSAGCPVCAESFVWRHDVDQTNGYSEDHPSTCRAELTEIGYEDVWHKDHYGNRYAVKRLRFEPTDKTLWVDIAEERRRQVIRIATQKAAQRWSVGWFSEEDNDYYLLYIDTSNEIGSLEKIKLGEVNDRKEHQAFFRQQSDATDFLARHGDWILRTFKQEILSGQGAIRVFYTMDPDYVW